MDSANNSEKLTFQSKTNWLTSSPSSSSSYSSQGLSSSSFVSPSLPTLLSEVTSDTPSFSSSSTPYSSQSPSSSLSYELSTVATCNLLKRVAIIIWEVAWLVTKATVRNNAWHKKHTDYGLSWKGRLFRKSRSIISVWISLSVVHRQFSSKHGLHITGSCNAWSGWDMCTHVHLCLEKIMQK